MSSAPPRWPSDLNGHDRIVMLATFTTFGPGDSYEYALLRVKSDVSPFFFYTWPGDQDAKHFVNRQLQLAKDELMRPAAWRHRSAIYVIVRRSQVEEGQILIPRPEVAGGFTIVHEGDDASSMKKHRLSSFRSAQRMTPAARGIMLWALTDLFGFHPEDHVYIDTRFDLGIPYCLRDGAFDRFRASAPYVRFQDKLEKWRSAWASSPFTAKDDLDDRMLRAARVLLVALYGMQEREILHRSLPPVAIDVKSPDVKGDVFSDGGKIPFFEWNLFIDGMDRYYIRLYADGHWTLSNVVSQDLAVRDPDLVSLLHEAGLLFEESELEAWQQRHIDLPIGEPHVVLDIDIEPYILLDSPTPYVWIDDRFFPFVATMKEGP